MLKLFTQENTPLFSSITFQEEFEKGFSHFVDDQNLYRNLECILFPGTEVSVCNTNTVHVPSYGVGTFYLDTSTLTTTKKNILIPRREEMIEELYSLVGVPYVWGGNIPTGISEKGNYIDGLRGLDCSGLLYYVTRGTVPRNTSQLMYAGYEVALTDIQPLDIIVWEGHMVIAISHTEVIESLHDKHSNVRISPLKQRLSLIEEPLFIRRVL